MKKLTHKEIMQAEINMHTPIIRWMIMMQLRWDREKSKR